jgi:hypothetical protein
VCLFVAPDFNALREESLRILFAFLKTEIDLGLTFAARAKYERGTGNAEHYEESKRRAIQAAEAIERFKERLPADAKLEIETGAAELVRLVSAL